MRAIFGAVVGSALLSVGSVAFADTPPIVVPDSAPSPPLLPAPPAPEPTRSVAFDLGAGTIFPLMIGAEATLELPYRILLQADLGWMPSAYSNTTVDLLGDFGAINPAEQTLIKSAIQDSFAGRFSAGWRPFSSLGLEVLAGYTVITAGGSVSGASVVDAYLGAAGSSDRFSSVANQSIPLKATLNNFHATVDWRFLFFRDHLVVRASVGYIQCFEASTTASGTALRPAAQPGVNKLNTDLEGFLNPYFTEYVKAPLLGLNAAYRF